MAIGTFILGTLGLANAAIIDFEGLTYSNVNSFTVGDATFTDSMGSGLTTGNYGTQGDGVSLGVFGDDDSKLEIDFTSYYDTLAFDFGNDDPGWGSGTDAMHLDLFDGATLLGSFSMSGNWNDLMDQRLVGSGVGAFNRAELYYDVRLIEIVDNIEYTAAPVPEPSTILLFGAGIAGLIGLNRRKKK